MEYNDIKIDESTGEVITPEIDEEITIEEDYTKLEGTTIVIDDDSVITDPAGIEDKIKYDSARELLKNKILNIIENGKIDANDKEELEILKDSYSESYNEIKGIESLEDSMLDEIDEIKANMVNATIDDVLNVLTENGTKTWLYKDDNGNILVDMQAIPELTILAKKLNLIATDGENEGEFKLTPEFIKMIVGGTGSGNAIDSIVNKYYVSTSKTELIGGTWVDDIPDPAEQEGKFLWIKTVTTFLDQNKKPQETTPICISAQDGANGQTSYFHIKYSSVPNPTASQMLETPNTYIGTYVDFTEADSTDPAKYTWSRFEGLQGSKGEQGIPGIDGANGKTTYLHIKYSNDGGKTFTANNGETPGDYIGTCTDFNSNDPGTVSSYTWSKIKGEQGQPGIQGIQGERGQQGIPGSNGANGQTSYFHIKYSPVANPTASQMTETPSTYIGTYVDFSPSDSTDPAKYTWSRFEGLQGSKGEQGIPGTNGTNGKTTYLHIKYSNDGGKTFTANNGEAAGDYIGTCTDFNVNDPTAVGSYTWSKIKGEPGQQGLQGVQGEQGKQGIPGTNGTNGKTSYFHIKYSPVPNPTASQMSETPNTYIGTYVDFSPSDSTDPAKYTWSRFEGLQGSKGEQGIPGTNGANGKTTYLHIKYSNDGGKTFTANNGETVGNYIGTCTDFNVNDPTIVSAYTWTKVKGDKGDQGIPGQNGVSVEEVIIQYSKGTSTSTAPTSDWSSSMPNYQEGYYLWVRTRVKYSNRTDYVYSSATCDQSWKANKETYTLFEQLRNKINLIAVDNQDKSSIVLTPLLIQLIAESDIQLSAKKIIINGLLGGSGWQVDEEGNLDIKDLNVRGTITCESMNVNNLISAEIASCLSETLEIHVKSGQTISQYLDDIPLNLNGYSVNIYLDVDTSENLELRRHMNGIVNIYLCGHAIKGTIRGNFNNSIYNILGGNSDSDTTTIGKIMPYNGYNIGSYYYSIVFINCPNVNLYNVKVYGDKVNANTVGIGGQQKSKINLDKITFVGCKYNVRTYSMAELYCDSSGGTSTGNSWSAGTGSKITLNATTQAGGGNNTYTSGNGQIISTGVKFSGTSDSSSNTSSGSTTTTRVETFKPISLGTYRSSVYNNWTKDACRQGDWGYGDCNGCFFYGNQFAEVKGKEITKVTITVSRSSGVGNSSGVSNVFQAHKHTSMPSGMPGYTSCNKTLSLAWGESGTVTITDSTILAGIKAGTIKGFGIKSAYDKGHYSALTNGTVKIYYKE